MDETDYTRRRLSEEWTGLIQRGVASGIQREAIVETMLEGALREYGDLYGNDLLGNYLRDLLLRLELPVTPHEVAEQLIIGEEENEGRPDAIR